MERHFSHAAPLEFLRGIKQAFRHGPRAGGEKEIGGQGDSKKIETERSEGGGKKKNKEIKRSNNGEARFRRELSYLAVMRDRVALASSAKDSRSIRTRHGTLLAP